MSEDNERSDNDLVDASSLSGDKETRPHWILGSVAIASLFAAVPLPTTLSLAAIGLACLAVVVGAFQNQPQLFKPVPIMIALLAIWLALQVTSDNVLSLNAASIGYRLSVSFFLGVLLGYLWPSDRRPPIQVVWWSIFIFSTVSLLIFLYAPALENLVSRRAGEYTSLFQGRRRLQGLWPGPFHAAMASVFLILSTFRAKSIVPSPTIRLVACGVGLYALYLTQVRTGIVAVLFGALILLFAQSSLGGSLRITLMLLLASASTLLAFPEFFGSLYRSVPALASLTNIFGDDRFLGRIDSWKKGYSMLEESPLLGYGPGSAGATLASSFPPDGHVTPHNFLLKYAVEGGVPALALATIIMAALLIGAWRSRFIFPIGVVVIGPIMIFGTTGTTVEALPVSFAFAIVLGVSLRCRAEESDRKNALGMKHKLGARSMPVLNKAHRS